MTVTRLISPRFQDQIVVIIGAAGGLGTVFAQAFAAEGAQLILAGRNQIALETTAAACGNKVSILQVDLTDHDSISCLIDQVYTRFGRIDVVVNAAGCDVRKPFAQHSDQDLHRLLDVNLRGAIQLTQTLLPIFKQQEQGTLVHIGGFADGRLAFPFYTVDVATRAGLRSFIEALNRELNHPDIVISYFCPAAADTEAERPYYDLWREMGVAIVPPEQVAHALLNAIHHKRQITIMGTATRLFAALNAVAPALADRILMRRYSTILRRYFEAV